MVIRLGFLLNTTALLVLIMILTNCSENDFTKTKYAETKITDKDFKEVEVIEAKHVEKINHHLLNPDFIHLADSILTVVESGVSDKIFKTFSTNNFTFLGSFGKRGKGPKEFSNIISQTVQYKDSLQPNTIMIYDWSKKIISELNLETIFTNSFSPVEKRNKKYVLPPELMLSQRVAFLNDTTVVAMGESTEGMLAFVNINTDAVSFMPFIPKIKKEYDLTPQEIRELYLGEFAINKQKKRIILALNRFPMIVILNLKGTVQRIIRFPLRNYPANKSENERIFFYRDVKVTNNYIYAVHVGLSYNDMEKVYENYYKDSSQYSTEVHVFDWTGSPVRKLVLKDKFIPFIQVDGANHQILAIEALSDELSILTFKSDVIK